MFNNFLRPWIKKGRFTSDANPPRKTFLVLTAMLLAAFGVQAQQILTGDPYTPTATQKISAPGTQTVPTSPMVPDPLISILPPGVTSNQAYWESVRRMRANNVAKTGSSSGSSGPILYDENEKGTAGTNDSPSTAERIRAFGLRQGQKNTATISGSLGDDLVIRAISQTEDDGAIPLANATGVTGGPDGISFSGVIGDGPMAGLVSDYDYVSVSLPANTTFTISVKTPEPFGDLDPFVSFYLADGTLIFQQDDGGDGFDTFVQLTVGANDLDFLMAIGGYHSFFGNEPADPFNSTGGSAIGFVGSEGTYDFEMVVFPNGAGDVDFYEVFLEKGDVFGAAARVNGGPNLDIYNSSEVLEKGASGFGSFGVAESPLPVNGNGVTDYVIERNGNYTIAVSGGFGPYELDLGVFQSEFEREKERMQVIWLDYNGGPVSKEPWFGFPLVTDHTPFRDFLPLWGLPNSDADVQRITDKITRDVRVNLWTEIGTAINRNLGFAVLGNDGTGTPDALEPLIAAGSFALGGITFEVSVVEVSGTTSEAFINTIGIASTIDPGNYAPYDAALVLLDVLSAPASGGNANFSFALNDVVLAPGVSKEDMVATVLSNVITHEAGHYLGNWHTDGFNPSQNVMDQGPGGLFNLAGIGPSGIFGAADQTNIGFIDDLYAVSEGFRGDENTKNNTAWALTFFATPGYYSNDMPEELSAQIPTEEFDKGTLLGQSMPNSLNVGERALINFTVSENSNAVMDLYDLTGNKVGRLFEGQVKGGETNTVVLNAGDFNLKPGIYLYKLDTPNGSQHKKIVVKE